MYKFITFSFLAATAIPLLAGCGNVDAGNLPATVKAKGVVTLDGEPVEGASIVASPNDGAEYPAFAISTSGGRFALKAFEAKDGAVPGSYLIQVSKTVEVAAGSAAPVKAGKEDAGHVAEGDTAGASWQNALPKKYASVATSGIEVTITEDGTSDLTIELTSQP